MFHGTNKKELKIHVGICLTDTRSIARQYGRNVYAVEVGSGVTYGAEIVDGYNRDTDVAPGDKDGEFEGWIEFLDESPYGKQHKTWRAMDKAAVDEIISVELLDED